MLKLHMPNASNVMLLTGAGFTKNFGGFLATEMWSQIFNDRRVQTSQKLREVLRRNYDYEAAYSKVIDDSHFSDDEKQTMRDVILDTYMRLDNAIRNWVFDGSSQRLNIYGLGDLISKISSQKKNPYFFTLNQDIFAERRWGHPSPGAPKFAHGIGPMDSKSFRVENFVVLPKENIPELVQRGVADHRGVHYIKLHGSYGWKSSKGSNQLVIGTNKEALIKREPLLQEYFKIFKGAIAEGDKKMLIIGYGFADKHINEALLKGVEDHGLELYVINPNPLWELENRMRNGHFYAIKLIDGIRGYFPYELREIFPSSQERTVHFEQILESLGF